MKSTKEFPFDRARRISSTEVARARKAIEKLSGKSRPKRKGRPPKSLSQKYVPISVRLHPIALKWLKCEARKNSVPYQTILNDLLLKVAA